MSVDPSSLFGKITPSKEAGVFEWVDGPVTAIVRHGGVLNISEINYMSPRVGASLYSLLDRHRYISLLGNHGEIVPAHPKLVIVADMNPGYRGTVDINAAFMNRFGLKLRWGYDPNVESKLLSMNSLQKIAHDLRARFGTELDTPVSTNMLVDFEKFSRDLGVEFAIQNFIATFNDSERHAVERVFNLQLSALKEEAGEIEGDFEDIEEDFEDVEFEYDL